MDAQRYGSVGAVRGRLRRARALAQTSRGAARRGPGSARRDRRAAASDAAIPTATSQGLEAVGGGVGSL